MPSAFTFDGRIVHYGNSLAIRIPHQATTKLGLKEGQFVNIRVSNDEIMIRSPGHRKKWSEKDLLKGVTPNICGPALIPDRMGGEIL
jgi:antitoxin component of MazEF toxin-antitoxin module